IQFIGQPLIMGVLMISAALWFGAGVYWVWSLGVVLYWALAIVGIPVLLSLFLVGGSTVFGIGKTHGLTAAFEQNVGRYQAVLEDLSIGTPEAGDFTHTNGVHYRVDLGPPVRVAFAPKGMLDNWTGIIHDPSGDVMMAMGLDFETGGVVGPEEIIALFGGDLVICQPLRDAFYLCSFT
ncbi:MAG: hypothetical protein ACPGYL_08850, partial [Rhodospirillaceae bacterium]